jgi:hypothetical protein
MKTMLHDLDSVLPFLGTLLVGCGAYVVSPAPMPKGPLPAGAGQVCVVRQGTDAALSTFPMRDNGVVVGATVGGSCFCYLAGAGRHELEARSDGYDTAELEVTAGKQHVILQSARTAVGIVRTQLEPMEADEGTAALKTCEYRVLTEVPEGNYKIKPGTVVVAR